MARHTRLLIYQYQERFWPYYGQELSECVPRVRHGGLVRIGAEAEQGIVQQLARAVGREATHLTAPRDPRQLKALASHRRSTRTSQAPQAQRVKQERAIIVGL
jgi:hypothetical protein